MWLGDNVLSSERSRDSHRNGLNDENRNFNRLFRANTVKLHNLAIGGRGEFGRSNYRDWHRYRLNRQNYTRGLALHAPTSRPREVGVIQNLIPELKRFANLEVGDRNLIIAVSPDVAIGSGIVVDNGILLKLIEKAPWIPETQIIESRDFALSKCVFVYCDCDELSDDLNPARATAEVHQLQLVFSAKDI